MAALMFFKPGHRSSLAVRADPEELELVGHLAEAVPGGNPLLNSLGETILNLDHLGAPGAN